MNNCKTEKNFVVNTLYNGYKHMDSKNLNDCISSVTENIRKFRFNDAIKEIYSFTKNMYCDWYIEADKSFHLMKLMIKVLIKELQRVCFILLSQSILKVIHPFVPFISDEIYFSNISHSKYLDQVKWPEKTNIKFKNSNIDNIDSALGLVTKLRNIKASLKIEPKATLILFVNKDLISKIINKETELLVNRLASKNYLHST